MYKNIIKQLKNNPTGCSLKQNGNKYIPSYDGYFIALTDNKFKSINGQIINKVKKQAYKIGVKNWYYGYWMDNKTGFNYLDVAIFLTDKVKALETAKKYNQRAIYSTEKNISIYL